MNEKLGGFDAVSDLLNPECGAELGDWRGDVLAEARALIHAALPDETATWKCPSAGSGRSDYQMDRPGAAAFKALVTAAAGLNLAGKR